MVPACQDDAGPWSYDPEAAKKLLDEAGWTVGADGIREKDGQKLSLRFTLPQGVPTTENEAGFLHRGLELLQDLRARDRLARHAGQHRPDQ